LSNIDGVELIIATIPEAKLPSTIDRVMQLCDLITSRGVRIKIRFTISSRMRIGRAS
jgi:hypothetical protein